MRGCAQEPGRNDGMGRNSPGLRGITSPQIECTVYQTETVRMGFYNQSDQMNDTVISVVSDQGGCECQR